MRSGALARGRGSRGYRLCLSLNMLNKRVAAPANACFRPLQTVVCPIKSGSMEQLDPEVARYVRALLQLERHLLANGDSDRASQVARCRVAAERSDGWSVACFLSLFGYMGDFNSAGLPAVTADAGTVNRQLASYIDEAVSVAKSLEQDELRSKKPSS